MKIVGIGLPKTGTKTLRECCRTWGLKHQSWDFNRFELLQESTRFHNILFQQSHKKTFKIMSHMEKFESFEDCPWYLLYREIDERFPDSKFILTRRSSEEVWFESYCKWIDRFGLHRNHVNKTRKYVFGEIDPKQNKEAYIQTYITHNKAVREYFSDKPGKMIELCWEEGAEWHDLSAFLGLDTPSTPFPHLNRSDLNSIDI